MADEKYVERIKSANTGEVYTIRDPQTASKQDLLVSGTNIKTINDQSLLGEGNIVIQGGGSGGTSDYTQLTNKPKINDVTLVNDLTLADLGAASASDLNAHTSDATIHVTSADKTTWSAKQDALPTTTGQEGKYLKVSDQGSLTWAAAGGSGGTSDYSDLDNKPQINSVTLAGNKSASDLGLISSDLGSEHAGKFLSVANDGSLAFAEAPEAALLEARVETLETEMSDLISEEYVDIDLTTVATTHETAKYLNTNGSPTSSTSWEYFGLANDGYTTINYGLYTGASTSFDHIDFWNSTSLSASARIGSVPITQASSYVTGTVEVPAGTVYITINNKRLTGEVVNTPTIIGVKGEKGTVLEMQDEIADIQAELEKIAGKTVKEGLRIAVIGDSISTRESLKTPEIVVQEEDIGVQLGGWLTIYDPLPMTLGGVEYTTADIGKYIIFTPTAEDVGKRVGTEHIYSGNANVKVWWQYLADLGATMINGTYCSASMSSHEKGVQRLCTAHSWHDQQIRRLGKRIPGTMQREAPDIIIMYRGCNDMTHTAYAKLTDGYFTPYNWGYPTDDVIASGYGFKEAVSIWISKLRKVYPRAQIVLATQNTFKRIVYNQFPTNNGIYSLPTFNEAVREIADFFGCKTIDFDKDGVTFENCYPTYISDSKDIPTHPNAKGHAVMGLQAITDLDAKLDLFNFEPLNLMGKVDHHIIANLEDATLSNTDNVYTGDTYEAELTPTGAGTISNVTITMGGVDVSSAYDSSTGLISIASVNGDIIISNTVVPVETVNLTQTLSHATSSAESTLPKNQTSVVTITADDGYKIENVTVTMGGTDITADSYTYYANGAEVRIANVTDDVTITATTTYVNEDYRVLKELLGSSATTAIITDLLASDLNSCVTKIHVITPTYRNGWGIFGDIFCNEDGSTSQVFSTGSSTGSTGVAVTAGEYLVKLADVDQTVSTIEIYAGSDTGLTNLLGSGSRSTAVGATRFSFLGFQATNSVNYGCTGQALQYCYMYDSSNNVIHHFIPVKQLSSNTDGVYDIVTGAFYTYSGQNPTFVDVTKTLSHVVCSAGSSVPAGAAHFILTAEDGYKLDTVTVTMGGTDITASSYTAAANNGMIDIANATDTITITASATLIASGYRVMNKLYGQEGKYVPTSIARSSVSSIVSKIGCESPRHNQGFGFFGAIFCNEYLNPTLDLITFNTGSTQSTEVQAQAGYEYIANLKDVSTSTGILEIYAGDDEEMTNLLGSASRSISGTQTFTYCGFSGSASGSYETTGQPLYWSRMYDGSGNVTHDFIPVTKLATDEEGLYDITTSTFFGFANR